MSALPAAGGRGAHRDGATDVRFAGLATRVVSFVIGAALITVVTSSSASAPVRV